MIMTPYGNITLLQVSWSNLSESNKVKWTSANAQSNSSSGIFSFPKITIPSADYMIITENKIAINADAQSIANINIDNYNYIAYVNENCIVGENAYAFIISTKTENGYVYIEYQIDTAQTFHYSCKQDRFYKPTTGAWKNITPEFCQNVIRGSIIEFDATFTNRYRTSKLIQWQETHTGDDIFISKDGILYIGKNSTATRVEITARDLGAGQNYATATATVTISS